LAVESAGPWALLVSATASYINGLVPQHNISAYFSSGLRAPPGAAKTTVDVEAKQGSCWREARCT